MIGIMKIFCCFIMLCILTACSKSEGVNIKNNQADQISSATEVNIEEAKKLLMKIRNY
ncbi:hypothetical protein CACET_c31590 [Clostridium aceticum]|uniref:Lipoprotein n=1 Tax=Clostridium aceticum TaxID=84022 RepID=A0A0G3WE19_9CLOT|nr:hypothetical protein [Clostridium aceticum]AKL96603.1 hypothetical protein CACET_c31590 [Clostridium aceticum]